MEVKIFQLADDTSLLIKNSDSIKAIVETLRQFKHLLGLRAIIEKTNFYSIGATVFDAKNMHSFKLSKDKFKVLGITIMKEESVSEENNFRPRLKAMETILRQWSGRKLSLKGKISHE